MNLKIMLSFLIFTIVSNEIPCQSIYSKFNRTCCIPDPDLKTESGENKFEK